MAALSVAMARGAATACRASHQGAGQARPELGDLGGDLALAAPRLFFG